MTDDQVERTARDVIASTRMEGGDPSPYAQQLVTEILAGTLTADDAVRDLLTRHQRSLVETICDALGEPYESPDGHGMRAYTWTEVVELVRARSDAWRTLLTRIEEVDPQWLDDWRRRRG